MKPVRNALGESRIGLHGVGLGGGHGGRCGGSGGGGSSSGDGCSPIGEFIFAMLLLFRARLDRAIRRDREYFPVLFIQVVVRWLVIGLHQLCAWQVIEDRG